MNLREKCLCDPKKRAAQRPLSTLRLCSVELYVGIPFGVVSRTQRVCARKASRVMEKRPKDLPGEQREGSSRVPLCRSHSVVPWSLAIAREHLIYTILVRIQLLVNIRSFETRL